MVISLSHTHTHTLSHPLLSICILTSHSLPLPHTPHSLHLPLTLSLPYPPFSLSLPMTRSLPHSLLPLFLRLTHILSLSPSLSSCAIPSSYTHSPSLMILIICSFLLFSIISLRPFVAFTPDIVRAKQDCISPLINVKY